MNRKLEMARAKWMQGVGAELDFWDHWMRTGGSEWPSDFNFRIDNQAPFQENLLKYLPLAQKEISILDVGSGPLTGLGKKLPDPEARLIITATDPLADQYKVLLRRNNLSSGVNQMAVYSEELSEHFSESSFDFVYMRNALDHSFDPLWAVGEMIHVVVKGGYVVLEHETNEAENEEYRDLHQWNICVEDGMFILWNKGSRFVVNEHYDDVADIICHVEGGLNLIEIKKK